MVCLHLLLILHVIALSLIYCLDLYFESEMVILDYINFLYNYDIFDAQNSFLISELAIKNWAFPEW